MSTQTTGRRSFALRANIILLRMTRNWLRIALVILSIFVALPFIAPTLMQLGVTGPARTIYTLYSPFCHQFAFRSIFLYGEQYMYPRVNAGTDLVPFEAYAPDIALFNDVDIRGFDIDLINSARAFLGNEEMGYKITICARDIATYSMLLIGGFIYTIPFVRRRLRPVPLWLYVILGLGPIGIDGFSQLLGYPPFNLWPPRETLPAFRIITGGIFGFMNAWLAFPYVELAMQDTRYEIEEKLVRANIRV